MNYQELGKFLSAALFVILGTAMVVTNRDDLEEENPGEPRDFAEVKKIRKRRKSLRIFGAYMIGCAVVQFLFAL